MNLILENVQTKHISLINELAKTLHFTIREDAKTKKFTAKQQEIIDDLKGALHEVELHQQGKITLPTFDELLNEL